MRGYELLYIIKSDLEEEKVKEVMDWVNEIIRQNGGEVIETNKWGKKRLAYEIMKYRDGIYVLVFFKAPAGLTQELERVLKISENILRYLVIRKEKLPVSAKKEQASEEQASEEQASEEQASEEQASEEQAVDA